jgi:hypothetical protein
MYIDINEFMKKSYEAMAFNSYRKGKSVPLLIKIRLGLKSIFIDPVRFLIDNFPGGLGLLMKRIFCKLTLNAFGKNSIIDSNVLISGVKNISFPDYAIAAGVPTKIVGMRTKINVSDV